MYINTEHINRRKRSLVRHIVHECNSEQFIFTLLWKLLCINSFNNNIVHPTKSPNVELISESQLYSRT